MAKMKISSVPANLNVSQPELLHPEDQQISPNSLEPAFDYPSSTRP